MVNNDADPSRRTLLDSRLRASNVARHVLRAIGAVIMAYVAGRVGVALIADGDALTVERLAVEVGAVVVVGTIAISLVAAIPIRRDLAAVNRRMADDERQLRERSRAQGFLRDVGSAFEMSEIEGELNEVAGLALRDAGAGRAEILVADASNAHVRRVAVALGRDAPGCGLVTPRSCPAVRQGHTLKFGDTNGLAACPRLRERQLPDGMVSTCIPINVLGVPSAVLHAVCCAEDDDLADGVRSLEGVAVRYGTRLGMIRAMAQSRMQAETDPLTGLVNRRAMENRVWQLRQERAPFALSMIDLDHFKHLNDTYGHDTGDRALRLFSRIASSVVRDVDVVCRHGGEEFVIIVAGADVTSAAPVLHRLRGELAAALADGHLPAFTFSAGLVDSGWSDDLSELLDAADRALLEAKDQGRDQLVIDDPARPSPPSWPARARADDDVTTG